MKPMINLTLLFLFWCTACSKTELINESNKQEKKWISKNITNYSFSLRINCFCVIERTGPHLIKVVNNKITSVNGLPYDPNLTGTLPTVSELFDIIQTKLSQRPFQQTIEYHPSLGYPTSAYFDMDERIADEEIGYVIESLEKQ